MAYGRFPLRSSGCCDRLLIVIQNGKASVKCIYPWRENASVCTLCNCQSLKPSRFLVAFLIWVNGAKTVFHIFESLLTTKWIIRYLKHSWEGLISYRYTCDRVLYVQFIAFLCLEIRGDIFLFQEPSPGCFFIFFLLLEM